MQKIKSGKIGFLITLAKSIKLCHPHSAGTVFQMNQRPRTRNVIFAAVLISHRFSLCMVPTIQAKLSKVRSP